MGVGAMAATFFHRRPAERALRFLACLPTPRCYASLIKSLYGRLSFPRNRVIFLWQGTIS